MSGGRSSSTRALSRCCGRGGSSRLRSGWRGVAAYEDTEGIVFTRENGARAQPDAVSKAFLRAQAGLGLPRISLHGCVTAMQRSCCATACRSHRGETAWPQGPVGDAERLRRLIPDDDTSAVDIFSKAVWGA